MVKGQKSTNERPESRSKEKPAGTRRKSRELALQMLFQLDMGKQSPDNVRKTFWSERKEMDETVRGFADDIFRVAVERGESIDQMIEAHTPNWRMERMAAVDRNVLRAAVAEFVGFPQTPAPIVINEAIEIARKFSSPEAVNFINGVLDSVAKNLPKTQRPADSGQ
jgi:N utilization substance protein B